MSQLEWSWPAALTRKDLNNYCHIKRCCSRTCTTLTDGPVQRHAGLLVPHQGGLSLIGDTHRWRKSNIPNIDKTPPLRPPAGAFGSDTVGVWRHTFNAGDVDVELGELLTGPLDTLVDRLDDLLGVLLHPPGLKAGKDVNTRTLLLHILNKLAHL